MDLLGRSTIAGNKGRKEEGPIKAGKSSMNGLSNLYKHHTFWRPKYHVKKIKYVETSYIINNFCNNYIFYLFSYTCITLYYYLAIFNVQKLNN